MNEEGSVLDLLVESVTAAYERTFDLLFREFDLVRYLMFALLAFLANCGEPSFSFNVDVPQIPVPNSNEELLVYFAAHAGFLLFVAVMGIGGIFLALLFLFVSSRGLMAFLDALVSGEPGFDALTEKGEVANRLFLFRASYVVGVPVLALLAVAVFAVITIGAQLTLGNELGAVMSLVAGGIGLLALPVVLLLYFFDRIVMELAAPIMFLQGTSVRESFQLLAAAPNADGFQVFVFLVARFFIGLGITLITIPIVCLCFCVMLIPGMNSVILLPFTVFSRNISMQWLARVDPAYAALAPTAEEPA
jgi:hypothetical protein